MKYLISNGCGLFITCKLLPLFEVLKGMKNFFGVESLLFKILIFHGMGAINIIKWVIYNTINILNKKTKDK